MGKKGQVTLFIMLGILIVAVVLIFFLWVGPKYVYTPSTGLNFDSCIKNSVGTSIKKLGTTGGFIQPQFSKMYLGEQIPYFCYTSEYYKTCSIQVPFLKQQFEKELNKDLTTEINDCYQNSLSELRSQGYSVSSGKLNYNISINPGIIQVLINAPTSVSSSSFSKFNVQVNSPIYEMLMISTSILQFETQYGDSDTDSLMLLYPNYIIEKLKLDDGTKIYTITDKVSGVEFKFASRSLVFPAGYQ